MWVPSTPMPCKAWVWGVVFSAWKLVIISLLSISAPSKNTFGFRFSPLRDAASKMRWDGSVQPGRSEEIHVANKMVTDDLYAEDLSKTDDKITWQEFDLAVKHLKLGKATGETYHRVLGTPCQSRPTEITKLTTVLSALHYLEIQ